METVKAIHGGVKAATHGGKRYARVYGLLIPAFEDTLNENVIWMPSHKSTAHVGVPAKSDGTPLTDNDSRGNSEADRHAKLAVAEHRVNRDELKNKKVYDYSM